MWSSFSKHLKKLGTPYSNPDHGGAKVRTGVTILRSYNSSPQNSFMYLQSFDYPKANYIIFIDQEIEVQTYTVQLICMFILNTVEKSISHLKGLQNSPENCKCQSGQTRRIWRWHKLGLRWQVLNTYNNNLQPSSNYWHSAISLYYPPFG